MILLGECTAGKEKLFKELGLIAQLLRLSEIGSGFGLVALFLMRKAPTVVGFAKSRIEANRLGTIRNRLVEFSL